MKRNFKISVRVTSQERCEFGFYVLINGSRLRFSTKAKAIEAVQAFLRLQRIQIVSLSEYSRRKSVRLKAPSRGAMVDRAVAKEANAVLFNNACPQIGGLR